MCAALLAVPVFGAACGNTDKPDNGDNSGENPPIVKPNPSDELVDYVSQLKLDLSSETKKQEVTIRMTVDGDTTHFDPVTNSKLTGYNAADFADTQGYIKARYIAVNTPESTGKIEKWGKTASLFTSGKLENAETIIVESDTDKWNIDSTGSRYVLWIWYKPKGETEFRNLNVEILQEGLALASNTEGNRYGPIAGKALAQAKAHELKVFSPPETIDENYRGDDGIVELTLRELRCHPEEYKDRWVAVTGIVAAEFSHTVYIEEYDAEADVHFGMTVYYGFQTGPILKQLMIGNEVRVVGSFVDFHGNYQISGVTYDAYEDLDTNTTVISKNNTADFAEVSAYDIVSGKLDVNFEKVAEDGTITVDTVRLNYGEAILGTTVTVKDLTVTKVYTTDNGGNSDGAISITCSDGKGTTITVRTEVLKDENGNLITEDMFIGKTMTVKGVIEKFNNNYQVKVYRIADFFNPDGTAFFN